MTRNHASQPDSPRKGQRVIIFPKDLPQLDAFLSTCDPNVDSEDVHPIAYEAILRESQKFETTPFFLREDCDMVTSDPFLAASVPEWLAKSKQVATGNRRRVLENGLDAMSSSDEDDPKMKPDKLTGVYTEGMNPRKGPVHLTEAQVAAQKAASQAQKAPKSPPQTPETGSSDDDDLSRPEWIWSQTLGHARRNKAWVRKLVENALALPAPESERQPTPMSSDTEDQGELTEDQKRFARTAKKLAGVDKSVTRSRAVTDSTPRCPEGGGFPTSDCRFAPNGYPFKRGEQSWKLARWGRFRVNGVRVCHKGTLLQTWVVIFFLRGGFLTPPDSAGPMAQRDNSRIGYLACTPAWQALCAAVRCSQIPRWGQTK
jgi:hypothetical protein